MIDAIMPTQGQSGTTLSQTVSATASWNRTFNWTITKTVNPQTLNLFIGDTGNAQYTITVTNDAGTVSAFISGEVCITNGGAISTEGLMSVLEVRSPVNGPVIATANLIVSQHPVLAPGETFCYPYVINISSFVPGQSFKLTANTTITNHSGHQEPFGPSTSASGNFPLMTTNVNETINVTDTNQPGQVYNFTAIFGGDSQFVNYSIMYNCTNQGENINTAKILQTNQTASATVTVKCYALTVTKTTNTSFTRTYNWSITKIAIDPISNKQITSLTLAPNEQYTVRYFITVTPVIVDSNFTVSGVITVTNPNPDSAAAVTVSDLISTTSGNISVTPSPSSAVIPAGGTATFSYSRTFNVSVSGTNIATVTLQNNTGLTTDFTSQPVLFDFSNAVINEINPCVKVMDSFKGQLSDPPVCRMPMTFTYDRIIGPFANCSSVVTAVDNTAAFMDTTAYGTANWVITVSVPCKGCTLTIGYWKTHAGFGPQPNVVGPLLAKGTITLGTDGGPKTAYITNEAQVVAILSFFGWDSTIPGPTQTADASNGINRLYAQLLAAKLNIANGADPSTINATITAADAFLATHDSTDWARLSRAQRTQVNTWQSLLEGYNTGVTGPGHCSEQTDVTSAAIFSADSEDTTNETEM